MAAVWMRLRAELRNNRRSLVALALLFGVFASVAIAAAAGARRTHSALPRFLEASDSADAFVGNRLNPRLHDAIERLPQVKASGRVAFYLVAPETAPGKPGSAAGVTAIASIDGRWTRAFDRPHIVRGRMPEASAVTEVVVNEALARAHGLGVGETVTFYAFAPDQLPAIFDGRSPAPSGPKLRLTITGIGRVARDLSVGSDVEQSGVIVLTPAFVQTHGASIAGFGVNSFVQLHRPTADMAAFRAGTDRLRETLGTQDDEVVVESVNDALAPTRDALSVQSTALWLFALAMTIAVTFVTGQAIARRVVIGAEDSPVLSSIGMSWRARWVAAMLPVLVVCAAGSVLAVAIAWLASGVFPTGFARLAEVEPGLRIDGTALGLGALVVVAAVLARVGPSAWRATRGVAGSSEERSHPSRLATAVARAGGSAPSVAGVQMAVEPGSGRRSVPVRSAAGGAVIGLLAVIASFTIWSSLSHVVRTPRLYGWNWDVGIAGPEDPSLVAELLSRTGAQPSIDAFSTMALVDVRLNGRVTQAAAIRAIKGDVFLTIVDGRAPAERDEIVLGRATLRATGLSVGDAVRVGTESGSGATTQMRVVGVALFAGIDGEPLDDGAGLRDESLADIGEPPDFIDVVARFKQGTDVGAELVSLQRVFGGTNVFLPFRPPSVENLRRVGSVPLVLGALIILMSIGTIAHALLTTARRRSRDLAILKTLGFARRQVRSVLVWQASTFGLIACIVGLPLGIAAGRWAWMMLAERLGVPVETVSPLWAITVAVPAMLVVVNIVSYGPARAAARTQPALVLRSE